MTPETPSPAPVQNAAGTFASAGTAGAAEAANLLAPFDGIALISYGGPNGPDDVLPFMRNATAGAGIPDERLLEVSGHYQRFGGVSPINACNEALRSGIEKSLAARGVKIPVVVGNRNWHPYIDEALSELQDRGAKNILTLFTAGFSSYSGCRQYRENLASALSELSSAGRQLPALRRVRPFGNTPGFVRANARAIAAAWRDLAPAASENARVVLVTHSIPLSMARHSGPALQPNAPAASSVTEVAGAAQVRLEGGKLQVETPGLLQVTRQQEAFAPDWGYLAQHLAVGARIMELVNEELGLAPADRQIEWDLAFCSRSGPAQAKWLEPDIGDHLEDLAAHGVKAVVAAPIGFLSDHMEVVFDLDTEAAGVAQDLDLRYRRAATAGSDPQMVEQLVELFLEAAALERGQLEPAQVAVEPGTYQAARDSRGSVGADCGEGCCTYPRTRPAHLNGQVSGQAGAAAHPGPPGAAQLPPAEGNLADQAGLAGGKSARPNEKREENPPITQGEKMSGHPGGAGHPGKRFITAPEVSGDPRDFAVNPDEVNAAANYSLHMIFKNDGFLPNNAAQRQVWARGLEAAVEATGVSVRGWYDCSGFRADADLMVWVTADSAEKCQAAYRVVRDWQCADIPVQPDFLPVWSVMSRHLPAEFAPDHLPACFGGWVPRKYAAVYPFVRSLDWYYLPKARRSAILKEHGMNGAEYNDVAISTLAAFALGDFEWTVTLEADQLERVMGVLRKQREVEARLFVKVDTPFYTGVRMSLAEFGETLPRVDIEELLAEGGCGGHDAGQGAAGHGGHEHGGHEHGGGAGESAGGCGCGGKGPRHQSGGLPIVP